MCERLTQEKASAQPRAAQRQVHRPEWLEARIAPQGAKGGYAFLIETEDFSVKLLAECIQNRPSVFLSRTAEVAGWRAAKEDILP